MSMTQEQYDEEALLLSKLITLGYNIYYTKEGQIRWITKQKPLQFRRHFHPYFLFNINSSTFNESELAPVLQAANQLSDTDHTINVEYIISDNHLHIMIMLVYKGKVPHFDKKRFIKSITDKFKDCKFLKYKLYRKKCASLELAVSQNE